MAYRKGCKIDIWFSHYINSENPVTFMNSKESARAAGYKTEKENSLQVIGSQNLSKLKEKVNTWLDEAGLSDVALKTKMIRLMNAMETKFFQHQGIVNEERVVPALETQRRTLDMAFRVKGLYQKDNEQGRSMVVIYPPEINKPADSGR